MSPSTWFEPTSRAAARLAAALVAAVLSCLSARVWACPSCSPGDEETRGAYLATTALLSLLPIGMVTLGAALLYRRMRPRTTDEGQDLLNRPTRPLKGLQSPLKGASPAESRPLSGHPGD